MVCRSMMSLIMSMKGCLPSAPFPRTIVPQPKPPTIFANRSGAHCSIKSFVQRPSAWKQLMWLPRCCSPRRKRPCIQGWQDWSIQSDVYPSWKTLKRETERRGTCRSSCGTPKWNCRGAWTFKETYPTSEFISLPPYMSISIAGMLV